MKPARLNNTLKYFLCLLTVIPFASCIKPYACECDHLPSHQKSHVLIYSTKNKRGEACQKNGQDSTVVCYIK